MRTTRDVVLIMRVMSHGQTVRKVEEGAIVDALLEEIKDL